MARRRAPRPGCPPIALVPGQRDQPVEVRADDGGLRSHGVQLPESGPIQLLLRAWPGRRLAGPACFDLVGHLLPLSSGSCLGADSVLRSASLPGRRIERTALCRRAGAGSVGRASARSEGSRSRAPASRAEAASCSRTTSSASSTSCFSIDGRMRWPATRWVKRTPVPVRPRAYPDSSSGNPLVQAGVLRVEASGHDSRMSSSPSTASSPLSTSSDSGLTPSRVRDQELHTRPQRLGRRRQPLDPPASDPLEDHDARRPVRELGHLHDPRDRPDAEEVATARSGRRSAGSFCATSSTRSVGVLRLPRGPPPTAGDPIEDRAARRTGRTRGRAGRPRVAGPAPRPGLRPVLSVGMRVSVRRTLRTELPGPRSQLRELRIVRLVWGPWAKGNAPDADVVAGGVSCRPDNTVSGRSSLQRALLRMTARAGAVRSGRRCTPFVITTSRTSFRDGSSNMMSRIDDLDDRAQATGPGVPIEGLCGDRAMASGSKSARSPPARTFSVLLSRGVLGLLEDPTSASQSSSSGAPDGQSPTSSGMIP